ncbi:SGNH/GDSL hydrolase family protein [Lactiplantibacillus plantarum]|uniref:SGNH/GDSL hydrolase family protein n=1 Tax=Lactiplantibacillus plantarum TaxID=1590 RepID=UPI00274090F5|nr:SGNH/GDSL hydrolase family protein [Lactiplantibacillus plantarum]WLT35552.1 hypothetical protein FQU65_10510 [Lactiplantibacillus plantarum]
MTKTLEFAYETPQEVKVGDDETTFTLVCKNEDLPVDLTTAKLITVKIGNRSGYLRGQLISIDSLANLPTGQFKFSFDKDTLANFPTGNYFLEVWVTDTQGTSIYPSGNPLNFIVTTNIENSSGATITTITFDDFVKAMNKAASTIAKGDKGDDGLSAYQVAVINGYKGSQTDWLASLKGDTGTVNNAGLISAPAFQSLQAQIDNTASILLNGAPKAVSQVSSMTDRTKNYVYIGTESGYTPGNWYYWSGTAWTSGGTYQSVGIGDKTVTTPKLADSSVIPLKTNFISKNSKNINLFDKNSEDNWFGKVVNQGGGIQGLSGWNYSHSIPCKPGDTFIVGTTSEKSYGYAGLFNGDQWISNVNNTNGYFKVPTDVTADSIRFGISASMFESTMIVLMPNELPNAYIPFNFLLDDQIKLDYANLENVSVEENDVTFLSKSQGSNKFDLNNTSPNVIYDNKNYAPLNGYVSTNDISVKNGDVVSWNFGGYGWVLDSQKKPIEFMRSGPHTISSINASFARIAIKTNAVATGMVTINEPIPTSYQPFRSSYKLADNIIINESNVIKSQTNETQNPISGKTVSIVGDSYSAFTGWVPEGNNISYNGTFNGVASFSDMWWFKVIQKFNMSLMLNESWSGSTICNTGYNASDATATSFLTRITKRYGATNTLGQKPQVLFILGGLNDTWAKSPLGNAQYSDWTTDDLKTTLGAYSKMINDILLYNPGIEIINFEYADVSQEIRDGKALICEHFGVKNVPISVVDSLAGHPTTTGMQQIVDQIIAALNV